MGNLCLVYYSTILNHGGLRYKQSGVLHNVEVINLKRVSRRRACAEEQWFESITRNSFMHLCLTMNGDVAIFC